MNDVFWNNKSGSFILIVFVLIPSVLFLNSGNLLLLGLAISVIFSWISLRLQHKKWSDVGLKKPFKVSGIIIIALISVIVLIPVSYILRHYVTILTHQQPNLEAFNAVKGNTVALMTGLSIVWIFGAFGEEMFFRGFLLNTVSNLFPDKYPRNMKMGLSLLITSVFVGIGHAYQGITGMVLTGIMGLFFGLIYLKSRQNLWSSILTHGLYDTVAFILVFADVNLDKMIKI